MIDAIIETLADGSWHDPNEISRKIPMNRLLLILNFLAKYNFLELREVWKGDPERPVKEARLTSGCRHSLGRLSGLKGLRNTKDTSTNSSNPNYFLFGVKREVKQEW